jgi:hypothetical protein
MNTREFIKSLHTGAVEFNNLTIVLPFDEARTNKTDNIYFVAWLKTAMNKRCKDSDISTKKYFVIDVDLRNQFDWEITNEEIIFEWQNMADNLHLDNEQLWKWKHIVFSGNGLHIYYEIESKSYKPAQYAAWVDMVYDLWDNFWWDEIYKSDRACKNIWRILRLPGSVNQKNWAEVQIIASQEIISDFDLIELAKQSAKEIKARKEAEQKERLAEQVKRSRMEELSWIWKDKKKQDDVEGLFKKINDIPAYIVSEKLHPEFPFYKNGRNFLSDEPNKWNRFTAFYYSSRLNWIVNWWSSYYNRWTTESVWSNSNLVKNTFWISWWETMKWFRSEFDIN